MFCGAGIDNGSTSFSFDTDLLVVDVLFVVVLLADVVDVVVVVAVVVVIWVSFSVWPVSCELSCSSGAEPERLSEVILSIGL